MKNLFLAGLLATCFWHTNALNGKLQMVGVDYFNEGKHFAFCGLQQEGGGGMLALDNVKREHCQSDTDVELEVAITAPDQVEKEKGGISHHVREPFSLPHAVVTKVLKVNGVAINDQKAAGIPEESQIKKQLEEMKNIAAGEKRRRLASPSGQSNLLIVRIKLADDDSVDSYCDENCALANGWGSTSARTSYAQASYGQLDISASTGVVKTVSLSTTVSDYSGCDFDQLGNDAVSALDISTSGFDVISFIMPFNINCGFGGVAYVGGTRSWVRYSSVGVMVHELGHSYGVWHAGTDPNNDGIQDSEYGDYSCVMGSPNNLLTMHGIHRNELGWITSNAVQNFECTTGFSDCDETFTIADLQEDPSVAVSDVRYSMVKTPRVTRSGDYYISYRAGTGLDGNLGSTYKNKVSLHYFAGGNTELVTTLSAGESYSDVINVFGSSKEVMRVTVLSIGSTGANVKVELFSHLVDGCVDVSVAMVDSYGDGWNGVNLYFTPDKSTYVTLSTGYGGTTSICLPPGTYSPFACDGAWQSEVSWSIPSYGLWGGASATSCVPSSGSFTVVGDNDDSTSAAPTRQPTNAPSAFPTRQPSSAPTSAPTQQQSSAPTPSPTTAPTISSDCVAAVVDMSDSYGDGWNGNVLQVGGLSLTLSTGYAGTTTVCLPPGTYAPSCCGGSWDYEVGWTISINGEEVSSGGADNACAANTAFEVVDGGNNVVTVAPSASPTAAPSVASTFAPSVAQTSAPSVAPSVVPTASPTVAPTSAPSVAQTDSPTSAPTASPTVAVTVSPTSVVDGCDASQIQKILDNQAQILNYLQELAGTAAAEGKSPEQGVEAPEQDGQDDVVDTSSTGNSKSDENSGDGGLMTGVYVLAAIGGMATLAAAAVLILHRTGQLSRLGMIAIPSTNGDVEGNRV